MNNNPYTTNATAQGYSRYGVPVPAQLTSPYRQPSFTGMPHWQGRNISHTAHLAQRLQLPYFPGQQRQMFASYLNPGFTGPGSTRIADVQPRMRQRKKSAPVYVPTPHTSEHTPKSSATGNPNRPHPRKSEHSPDDGKRCTDSFSQTSSASGINQSAESAETSTSDDTGMLPGAFAGSSVNPHSSLQNDTHLQVLMAELWAATLNYETTFGIPPSNALLARAFHSLLQQNQNYKTPLLPTPTAFNQPPVHWMPANSQQCFDVIQCLNLYRNQRVYGDVIHVTDYKSAGLGRAHIYPLHIKFRIWFPEAFQRLPSQQIKAMKVEGNLAFNQSEVAAYVKKYSEGAFYDPRLQKVKHAKEIPIYLKATALIDEANRRITPESQQVLNHIQSLLGQPITADILIFFNKHQGGIARHYDEASGINTRFLFRLPDQEFKSVPIAELSNKYRKLQAKIKPIDDEKLKSYVFGLGAEAFMRDFTISKIKLRSSEVSLLPKED
ncbi:hypothetical protein ACTL6P_09595 [Endozoicomonas acroporae]|uniref:hypothetical protein n=1 Tax=Endozoicomonas acroporae TaxID=1701104 RepID=UPI0011AF010E|nr:hypothetical protein [Endozoicomonas acroporae]